MGISRIASREDSDVEELVDQTLPYAFVVKTFREVIGTVPANGVGGTCTGTDRKAELMKRNGEARWETEDCSFVIGRSRVQLSPSAPSFLVLLSFN
jgi:hypothetical protein